MTEMNDGVDRTYDWWTAALKGTRGPIDADNPKAGLSRTKVSKSDPSFIPVAYWYDSVYGSLRCHKNGNDVPDLPAREMWPHASRRPVSEEAYFEYISLGTWADNDVTVAAQQADEPADEIPPELALAQQISEAKNGAAKYEIIESDEGLALAQTLRSHLTNLAGEAKKKHKAEKEHWLEGGRAVDAKWFPMAKVAETAAMGIRRSMEAFNDVKLSAARQAAAAQTIASEARPNAPAPSTQIRGGSGRAASVAVKPVVTEVDLDKCFAQFRNSPQIHDCLMELAQQAISAGIACEGATVEQKSVIR